PVLNNIPTGPNSGLKNGVLLIQKNPLESAVTPVAPVSPQALTAVEQSSPSATSLNLAENGTFLKDSQSLDLVLGAAGLSLSTTPSGSAGLKDDSTSLPINGADLLQQIAGQIAAHGAQSGVVSRLSFQLIPENLGR